MTYRDLLGLLLASALLLPASPLLAQQPVAIKADRIYTAAGPVIENGVVLVENGKIARVGTGIAVPPGARVVEARTVIPGLVDMHTHLGVYSLPRVTENEDGNEATDPLTPQVRAIDSFNFDDPALAVGLAGGVTTIVSRPGSANVIGGTSVAVKLKISSPDAMVLKEVCDLKMALEGNPVGVYGKKNQMPATMMGVYHLARRAFVEAAEYMKSWDTYEKQKAAGKSPAPPKRDLGKDALVMALKREIPVHIHVATASEIATAIRLADEFKLRLSLGHAYWAHLLVKELANRKDVHFNVGPPMFFSYFDDPLTFKNTPAILSQAGLSVSLQTDALGGAQQNLLSLAALCVRYGMTEEAALGAVTLAPARAVGLDSRVGSIEVGKDADMVLLDGPPFEMTSSIERVVVDGKVEYEKVAAAPAPLAEIPGANGSLRLPDAGGWPERFALHAGTLLTMAGAPVKDGWLLVNKGKIETVGANLPIPEGYPVVDAREFVVMPGLVSARSYLGIASNWRQQAYIDEDSKPVVPEMEVKHAIEPAAPHFAFSRQLGITTAMVTPGNKNVIGGRGVVLKTTGAMVDRMLIRDQAVMVCGLGNAAKRKDKMPSTRMGIAALLRETLVKAREYRDKMALPEKDRGELKRDLSMEAMVPVLAGEMPLLAHCERREDILAALRIADEFKLKVILDGATDAYKLADEIGRRNIPVIVEDVFRGAGNIEDAGFNPANAALLAKAGVKVAFKPLDQAGWVTPGAGQMGGDLLHVAAFSVRNGMTEEAALRAVTIDAAAILGVDKRVGSLEAGKDADLLILRGHPFRTTSVPEAVLIDGKLAYQRADQAHLR